MTDEQRMWAAFEDYLNAPAARQEGKMSKKQNHSQEFNELEGGNPASPYVVITADPHLELQVVDTEFNQIDCVRASWIADKEGWEADADNRLLAAGWRRTSEWRTTGCDVARVEGGGGDRTGGVDE